MKPYQDKDWLIKEYENEKSIYGIAKNADCSKSTIFKWMNFYGIQMHGIKGMNQKVETKRKISMSEKGHIGGMLGKHHSEETKLKMSICRRGSGNSNWKGGKTKVIRAMRKTKEYIHWRNEILKRANGRCELCGKKTKLEVHHKISVFKDISMMLDPTNGIALCHECHLKEDKKQHAENVD